MFIACVSVQFGHQEHRRLKLWAELHRLYALNVRWNPSLFSPPLQMSGHVDSASHGAPLPQQQSQGLHGNTHHGSTNQMVQRSNQTPHLQGDGSFGLAGSAEVSEPTLDVS